MAGTLARFLPGWPELRRYDRQNLPADLRAGLSVAAVAVPVGVAYAELAGFNPAVGLYSSILPLLAYALFGTSRQLIVGPDAATCAVVAAAVAPLAGGDPETYLSLSITLAALAAFFCIAAGALKLGALADFLSRPILTGFMNGIALSIVLGQLGKILGFKVAAGGILPRILEVAQRLGETHGPTLAVGLGAFAVLLLVPRVAPRLPASLVAMVAGGVAVALLGLDQQGVAVVGEVPGGLPRLHLPAFPVDRLPELVADAAGLALISFSSAMATARSFAARNGYDVDTDQELTALGAANFASALSQGFAISGGDSRTAVNDAAGGRTRMAGVVAALALAVALAVLTEPLRYVPVPALGAVLVMAALSLVDLPALRVLLRVDRREFVLSLLTTLGVVVTGVVQAILLVVALSLVLFIRAVARPSLEVLGRVPGRRGFHGTGRHEGATTVPGLLVLRFNGPLVFFNAGYFRRSVLAAVAGREDLRWLVLDMIPMAHFDVTGVLTFAELVDGLVPRGVQVVLAGRQTELADWAKARRVTGMRALSFPTVGEAVRAFGELAGNEGSQAANPGASPA